MDSFSPRILFRSVDFPTFGAPTMAMWTPSRNLSPRRPSSKCRATSADTAATAQTFFFYIFELTAATMLEIGVRAFYAQHDTRTPVIVGGGAFVLNVVLGVSLLPVLGFPALALSLSLAIPG